MTCGLVVCGERIAYSAIEKTLTVLGCTAPLDLGNAPLRLQVLVDRTSLEVFANDGEVSLTSCFLPASESTGLSIYSQDGAAAISTLQVFQLCSAWQNRQFNADADRRKYSQ